MPGSNQTERTAKRPPALLVGRDHGAVAGEAQLHALGRGVLDRDVLLDHRHRLEAGAVAVLARRARARLVDVEVLLVDREDRQAEGDVLVVADRDARERGLAGADDVQPGADEVREVAQRRHALGAVRVVGEDRPARARAPAGDRPVVRALLPARPRAAAGRGELDRRDRQVVDVEHVGGDGVEVEALGDLVAPGRLELLAQRLRLAAEVAQDERALDLVGEVGDEPVAADPHDVLGRPALGPVAERLELDRQRRGPALDLVDVGVDARGEGGGDLLGVVAVGGVLAREVAAVEEQPRGAVLLDVVAAERGRQPPEPAAAPQVDLPEPVARGVEALEQERVGLGRAVDVRDPPAVDEDLAGRRQAGEDEARLRAARAGAARPPRTAPPARRSPSPRSGGASTPVP